MLKYYTASSTHYVRHWWGKPHLHVHVGEEGIWEFPFLRLWFFSGLRNDGLMSSKVFKFKSTWLQLFLHKEDEGPSQKGRWVNEENPHTTSPPPLDPCTYTHTPHPALSRTRGYLLGRMTYPLTQPLPMLGPSPIPHERRGDISLYNYLSYKGRTIPSPPPSSPIMPR